MTRVQKTAERPGDIITLPSFSYRKFIKKSANSSNSYILESDKEKEVR